MCVFRDAANKACGTMSFVHNGTRIVSRLRPPEVMITYVMEANDSALEQLH